MQQQHKTRLNYLARRTVLHIPTKTHVSSRKFHLQHVVGVKSGLAWYVCMCLSLNHLVRVTHAMYVRPRGYISHFVFHTTIRIKEL